MLDDRQFDAILADARRGDGPAWGILYDEVAPIVLAYLRSQSLRDPEDVAGEVMLHLVRDIDRFEGDARAFRSWVLGIAHHRMLDRRRAERRRPAFPVPSHDLDPGIDDDDPADAALVADELVRVHQHLDRLTDDQREVVILRVIADLSLEETADVMGKSVGAVKALQHRAFGALRTQVSGARNPGLVPDASPA
jgi:RNA polymerase sigma-70 factor (ECF subfamily)